MSSEPAVNYPVVSSRPEGGGVILPQSSEEEPERSLPDVGEVSVAGDLIASGVEVQSESRVNLVGVISWVCIALGVIVVVVVLLVKRHRKKRYPAGRPRRKDPPVMPPPAPGPNAPGPAKEEASAPAEKSGPDAPGQP